MFGWEMVGMNKNWREVGNIVIGLYFRMVKGISKYVINVYIMWIVCCFFFFI